MVGEVGGGRGNRTRRVWRLGLAALVACVTLGGAAGASSAASSDALSEAQLAEFAPTGEPVDKSVPPAAEGLSTRLVELSSPKLADAKNARQANAVGLPRFGGDSLQRDGDRLIVQARVEQTGDATIDSLRAAGAKIIFVSHRYGTVDLAITEDRLRDLTGVSGVTSVVELLQPVVNGGSPGAPSAETQRIPAPCGGVISEGDTQMRVAEARSTYEVDGTGVKVGVISDSYDKDPTAATRASADVGSGDLPGPGNPCGKTASPQILSDTAAPESGPIDEGRAMMQIVHDMAPGAQMAFADSANSEEAFANNIRALNGAGAHVIVDDITYTAEPMYQDGPISVAVNEVTANGRTYFSSAANSNVIVSGKNVGSYEAQAFRDSGGCTDGAINLAHCFDFDPEAATDNTFCFEQTAGNQFGATLQWAEPRNGVTTDLDMYLFDPAANAFVDAAQQDNLTSQLPFENMQIANGTGAAKTYCIVIDKFAGGNNPRFKFILSRASLAAVEFLDAKGSDVIGPSIYGHNGAENAVSTAAVPYNNSGTLESFSSYGPVTLTHGPVNGTTPAGPLATPQVLAKPDISATDNNRTTFFLPTGNPGEFRFSGTSAAAPHAAGVAALQLQANPSATPDLIKQAQYSTAVPVGSLPAAGTGAGLLDAVGAVGAVIPEPEPEPEPTAPLEVGIGAKKKQRINRLQVSATCTADCTVRVTANGKGKVKKKGKKKGKKKRAALVAKKKTIRFKARAQANLLAGVTEKIKVPVSKRIARKFKKAKGKVTFRAEAVDALGQVSSDRQKAKLKPKKKKKKK